ARIPDFPWPRSDPPAHQRPPRSATRAAPGRSPPRSGRPAGPGPAPARPRRSPGAEAAAAPGRSRGAVRTTPPGAPRRTRPPRRRRAVRRWRGTPTRPAPGTPYAYAYSNRTVRVATSLASGGGPGIGPVATPAVRGWSSTGASAYAPGRTRVRPRNDDVRGTVEGWSCRSTT